MMYYMALLDGLSPVPDSDDSVRARVEQWRQEEGISALYDYLGNVDSVSHQRLNATDTQRITRAIEVYLQTDRPISDWQREPKQALAHHPEQQWHALSVIPDRPWLHARIEQRLDIMWQEGLVAEVVGLLEKYPLTPNMPSMRCVGYRQVLEYLVRTQHPVLDKTHLDKAQFYEAFADSKSLMAINKIQGEGVYTNAQPDVSYAETEALACQEMQNKSLYATRQLAKRQYTWLRKVAQLPDAVSEFDDAVPKGMVLKNFTTMAQARDYLF